MKKKWLPILFASGLMSLSARAQSALSNVADLIEFNADKYTTNLETKKTEVEGNVLLKLGEREVYADKLTIDTLSGSVECTGHVLYKYKKLEIEAEGVRFNLKTGLGTFYNAVVRNQGSFHLEGKEIVRESENIYVAKVGKISFCQDCPQAWSLVGDRIRVDTEKYAELHHAVVQVKDVPLLYLPLIFYPAQDKKFSGFLIPYFRYSKALGAQLGIPFYWAVTDGLDLTLDYRYMSLGGHRNNLETRLRASEYTFWNSQTSWIRTPDSRDWIRDRFALHYDGHIQALPHWALLAHGNFVSDVEMSRNFEDDSVESRLPNYTNDFFVEAQYQNFSLFGGLRIPQDNLDRTLSSRGDVSWTLPEVKAGIPLTPLYSSELAALLAAVRIEDLGVRRFENGSPSKLMNRDPFAGNIVSGDRYSGIVDLSLPINFDYFRSTSKVLLRGDYYDFVQGVSPNSATRARVVLEQKLEMDFSRIWELNFKRMPRLKHIFTPYASFSYSPAASHSDHEFFRDCVTAPCPTPASRFDLFDGGTPSEKVRLGTEEAESRLRDHRIVTYGFKTQFLGKLPNKIIQEIFFIDFSQDYNLKNNRAGRLRLLSSGTYGGFTLRSQVAWDITEADLDLLNSLSWDARLFRASVVQSIRTDTDNLGGQLRIKRVGPFELATDHNYDRRLGKLIEQNYYLSYYSGSNCWRFDLGLKRRLGDSEFEYAPSIQIQYAESIKQRNNFEI